MGAEDYPEELEFIAEMPRAVGTRMVLQLGEWKGNPFLILRLWNQGFDGKWWPTDKGVTIRRGEIDGLIDGLRSIRDDFVGLPRSVPRPVSDPEAARAGLRKVIEAIDAATASRMRRSDSSPHQGE